MDHLASGGFYAVLQFIWFLTAVLWALMPLLRDALRSKTGAMNRTAVVALCLAGLAGCATPIKQEVPRALPESRLYVKNYEVGQKKTVNVGEPLVKLQDYWVETLETPFAVPDRSVTLKGGLVDVTLVAGAKYPVRGKMAVDGSEYALVALSNDTNFYQAVLIRPDGSLLGRIATYAEQLRGVVLVAYELSISDSAARLVRESQQSISTKHGYQNFELLYTGRNASALTLTYREFSPEGIARVAFFQNLTYEVDARTIAFKNFRIAVESATAESIVFTVVADGM